jgi:RND family efflux transporter MFP subunit
MKTRSDRSRRHPAPPSRWTLASCALLALGACSRPAPPPDLRVVAVVKTVRTRLANSMTLQAEFEPYQDIMVHGKVSGYVSQIRVDIGDRLKAGDLIATVEVPELSDQLDSAVAAEQRARADNAVAHLDYQRLEAVKKSQPALIAQQDLDEASAKDSASAAALAGAKAEADRNRALVSYTRITAPFAGVITQRFVDLGSLIQAGTSSNPASLVELAQDDLLRLRFPIPEAETPSIHDGEKVEVTVGALHRTFSGRIVRNTGAIDRATRTMLAEVDVPNRDERLKAGMYASILLPLEEANNTLAVPLQALSNGDHPTVLVVGRNGAIEERAVTVGLRTANRAEIQSGLAEGDRVVVSDRGGLHAGDRVAAKEMDATFQE